MSSQEAKVKKAKVKTELEQRIDKISRADFIQQYVTGRLDDYSDAPINTQDIIVHTVQNDGTGPATIEYRADGCGAGLFGKLYSDDTGAHAYSVLYSLWQDGFKSGQKYQVPEPLAFLPEFNLVLMRAARGECLASYVGRDNDKAEQGVRQAANWLLQLHGTSAEVGTVDQPWYMFLKLSDRLSKAAVMHPQELKRLTSLLDQLDSVTDWRDPAESAQSHGQFRPIHVFLDDDTVTVIDLDRSRPSQPAKDLAEFIHRLRTTVFQRTGAIDQADVLTRAFLGEYAEKAPSRLCSLPFYQGFHILVSLCRHMKRIDVDSPNWEPTLRFYLTEFRDAMSAKFLH